MQEQHIDTAAIRRAREDDLEELHAIWYANEVAGQANPPPPGPVLSGLRHVLATGTLLLAERAGHIAGFAGLIERGSVAYLTDLFVREDLQSSGIGAALLDAILPRDERTRCTLSSRDVRALALYIRAGMRPAWPCFWLRAEAAYIHALPEAGVAISEAEAGDPELVRWDAAIGGRERPEEHAYWLRDCAGVPLWFLRDGQRVGYGYVQRRSDEAVRSPDAYTLGPIGATSEADALACVVAAARWARERAAVVRLDMPGPHPALPALLAAGFRITYVETFLSSASAPFAEVTRYLPSGSTLF